MELLVARTYPISPSDQLPISLHKRWSAIGTSVSKRYIKRIDNLSR